ncbi:replication-relaxation family protein, partial [Kitasatospora sp. MAP5-34]|uniref:replication-relaxation family protein n=1 Tax=Kitasatospora sp. MAP5-34 TaxID=3035102 RepID=UPI00247424ED
MAMPPEVDHQVVAALFQFRMATAEQLRVLHTPGAGPEQMRRRLRRLKGEGLVEEVVLPQAGKLRARFLTEHGSRIAATFPELEGVSSPPLPGDKSAARLRLGHILAVVRTQVAFVAGARAAGDECAPLDFLPEAHHRYGEGTAGAVIPDGLLRYVSTRPGRALNRAFVEVDRATMSSEKLASKLIGYARFHSHRPSRCTSGAPSPARTCCLCGSSTTCGSRVCCSSWPTTTLLPNSGRGSADCGMIAPVADSWAGSHGGGA